MARHDQKVDQLPSRYDILKDVAQQLAEVLGIQYDRLFYDLTRLSGALEVGDESSTGSSIERAAQLMFNAISVLGEDQGLGRLERTDPLVLERRIRTLSYLRSEAGPRYTPGELQDQLRGFLDFQKEIESFLIQTGLPPRKHKASPWLFLHLGRLYDTRCTGSPYPREQSLPTYIHGHGPHDAEPKLIPASACPEVPPYTWVKRCSQSPQSGYAIQYCEYADADVLPGIYPSDANRLEAERRQFLTVRIAVINELIQSCRKRKPDGLCENCLAILDRDYKSEAIQFFLRMDSCYLGGNASARDFIEITPKMSPGGLTNVLEVVGHVEDELHTKRFEELKRAVSPAGFEKVFKCEGAISAAAFYFKCTRRPEFKEIVKNLDEYAESSSTWWTAFGCRIAAWLDPSFRITIPVKARPKYAERLKPLVQEYVVFLETKADSGESLVVTPPVETRNAFRYENSTWTITFSGKTVSRANKDGYFYIAELLKQPGEQVDAVELQRRLAGWRISAGHSSRKDRDRVVVGTSKSDDDRASADLRPAQTNLGQAVDDEAIKNARMKLELHEEALANAEAEGRGAEAAEFRDEIQKLKKYIKENTDHHGQPKWLSKESKKAGDAVRNAINRVLNELENQHPGLHQHLLDALTFGTSPTYQESKSVNWDF